MGGEDGRDVYLPQAKGDESTAREPLVEMGHDQRGRAREAGEELCVCVCVCEREREREMKDTKCVHV